MPLLGGVSPQEFHSWAARRQAQHLAGLAGAAVMASLYQQPSETPSGAAVEAPKAAAAAGASACQLGCALLRLDVPSDPLTQP